jgi:hypothetical protein
VFYQRREDITTYLRVHAIPGVMDFFDYSPAATGMTYRNDLNPAGVRVDGVPDAPALGPLTVTRHLFFEPGGRADGSRRADRPPAAGRRRAAGLRARTARADRPRPVPAPRDQRGATNSVC